MASCWWIALSAIAFLGACGRGREPLGEFNTVQPFTLTADSGEEFPGTRLAGKIWIANFIYTTCPGPCPRTTRQMASVQAALASHPDVKLVSFTVDPDNDTPATLAAYAKRNNAEPGRWFFLTGSKSELDRIALKDFMLGKVDGKNMDHSTRFVLVDRKGRVRRYYDTTEDTAVRDLVADVALVEKEAS